MTNDILPERIVTGDPVRGDTYSHPAFGVITMAHHVGGNTVLFGSDVAHPGAVGIRISTAELNRHIGHDWYSSASGDTIVEFEMSHAQFVNFVASPGNGQGTPVTLRVIRDGKLVPLPGIKRVETKVDSMRREIEADVREQIEALKESISQIEANMDGEKFSKRALREQVKSMKHMIGNLPSNLGYSVDCAKEAVENMTTAAKVDIEAYIDGRVRAIGLRTIEDFRRLGNKDVE